MTVTKKGRIEGIQKDGYRVYFGIPYAKPPVGSLRWKAPQETEAWEDVLYAKSLPSRSMQMGEKPGDEFYGKEFRDDPA